MIRRPTPDDLQLSERMQKRYSKKLGYFPAKRCERYLEQEAVLVAEARDDEARPLGSVTGAARVGGDARPDPTSASPIALPHGRASLRTPIGFILYKDRYLKRDELGVVYQLCVDRDRQRGLVGAALLKAAFERSAYGCRLYCCWCAQDLAANKFWEAMGFVPLAFRAGSEKKGRGGRTHILWQKRISEGDDVTPYCYPFQTTGGAMRADRLAFPIPPGTHWSEVEAVNVPMVDADGNPVKALPPAKKPRRKAKAKVAPTATAPAMEKVTVMIGGKMRTIERLINATPFASSDAAPVQAATPPKPVETTELAAVEKQPVVKVDPRFVKLNRELRDRYLERLNAEPDALPRFGKYDATRALPAASPEFVYGPHRLDTQEAKALPLAA
jgi:hypothetical protein